MRQFNPDEAIAIVDNEEWKDWTDEEIVRFQLFQRLLCVPFDRFQQAIESTLNRSVFTHEFSSP